MQKSGNCFYLSWLFCTETFTLVTATGLYDARHGNRTTSLI